MLLRDAGMMLVQLVFHMLLTICWEEVSTCVRRAVHVVCRPVNSPVPRRGSVAGHTVAVGSTQSHSSPGLAREGLRAVEDACSISSAGQGKCAGCQLRLYTEVFRWLCWVSSLLSMRTCMMVLTWHLRHGKLPQSD
jgi:hypothetical protein